MKCTSWCHIPDRHQFFGGRGIVRDEQRRATSTIGTGPFVGRTRRWIRRVSCPWGSSSAPGADGRARRPRRRGGDTRPAPGRTRHSADHAHRPTRRRQDAAGDRRGRGGCSALPGRRGIRGSHRRPGFIPRRRGGAGGDGLCRRRQVGGGRPVGPGAGRREHAPRRRQLRAPARRRACAGCGPRRIHRSQAADDEPGTAAPAGRTRDPGASARAAARRRRGRVDHRSGGGDAGAVRAPVRTGLRRDAGQPRCARGDLRPARRTAARVGAGRRAPQALHPGRAHLPPAPPDEHPDQHRPRRPPAAPDTARGVGLEPRPPQAGRAGRVPPAVGVRRRCDPRRRRAGVRPRRPGHHDHVAGRQEPAAPARPARRRRRVR